MAVNLGDYGLSGKRKDFVVEKADVKVGSFVRWDSNGSVAQGKVEKIVSDGKINFPNSSF